jgi:hypothetical protein
MDADLRFRLWPGNPRPLAIKRQGKKQIIAYYARVEKRFMTRKVTAPCFRTRLLLLSLRYQIDCLQITHVHIPTLSIGRKAQNHTHVWLYTNP